jgi:hypothetical protein
MKGLSKLPEQITCDADAATYARWARKFRSLGHAEKAEELNRRIAVYHDSVSAYKAALQVELAKSKTGKITQTMRNRARKASGFIDYVAPSPLPAVRK